MVYVRKDLPDQPKGQEIWDIFYPVGKKGKQIDKLKGMLWYDK